MPICAIVGCFNGYPTTKSRLDPEKHQFFQMPKSNDIRRKWLEKINRNTAKSRGLPFNADVACICAKHFRNEDFKFFPGEKDLAGRIRTSLILKENAVPTVFLSGDIPVMKGMNYRFYQDF